MLGFRLPIAVLAAVSCCVPGCAGRVSIDKPDSLDSLAGPQSATLPFITNRDLETDEALRSFYGDGRGELSAGYCTAQLGGANGFSPKAKITAVRPVPVADVLGSFRRPDEPNIVVYVHGYHIGFEKGCRRASMLQQRIGLEGRLLFFSWPADGRYLAYARDVSDLEWSLPDLGHILAELSNRYGAARIDLVGHSLGARGLVDALVRMSVTRSARKLFNRLVLVAPDIDTDLFRRDLNVLRSSVDKLTVYVSDNDRALIISREVNGYPRLGEAGEFLTLLEGIDTVDVSPTGITEVTGHLYHIHNPAVVEDLRRLLGSGSQSQSGKYRRKRAASRDYWELVPIEVEPSPK